MRKISNFDRILSMKERPSYIPYNGADVITAGITEIGDIVKVYQAGQEKYPFKGKVVGKKVTPQPNNPSVIVEIGSEYHVVEYLGGGTSVEVLHRETKVPIESL